jgi:hypothetical protein
MSRQSRSNLALGVILILVGGYFLAQQFFPDFVLFQTLTWPMIVIGVGVLLLVIGLLTNQPDMAVPAAVVAGIGGLLYYQNATNDWESWAYAWTLIPGFVGVGTLLAGLLGENLRQSVRHGFNLILISLVMFAIFFSIFGGKGLGEYWPVLIILLGVWMLVRSFWRGR